MKAKAIFLLLLFITTGAASAQKTGGKTLSERRQSILEEKERYVQKNVRRYRLNEETVKRVREKVLEIKEHGEGEITEEKLAQLIKERDLEKLFFTKYPEKALVYYSTLRPSPENLPSRTECSNGSFEDDMTDSLDFDFTRYGYSGNNPIDESYAPTGGTPISLASIPTDVFSDTSVHVSLVTPGDDPKLASLDIVMPRVKSGDYAIRLGNEKPPADDGNQTVKLTKTFTATGPNVSYSFLFICENPPAPSHGPTNQPRFIARLYDEDNNILSQNDIVSAVSNTAMFFNATPGSSTPTLYTGWRCANLSTEDVYLRPNIADRVVRLEITVNDCTLNGHWGYAYIDDICTDVCSPEPFGSIKFNSQEKNCPEQEIQVCGTYTLPYSIVTSSYGTLTALTFEIFKEGVTSPVSSVTDTSPIGNSATPNSNSPVDGGTFCFTVTPDDFGVTPGNYEFRVRAEFGIGSSGNYLYASDVSANPGPDVVFADCAQCPATLTLTSTTNDVLNPTPQDQRQAEHTISASNYVDDDATAIYHAGEEVLLSDGFTVKANGIFRAYIQGCDYTYVARTQNAAVGNGAVADPLNGTLLETELQIFPNPAETTLAVEVNDGAITEIRIFTLDGRQAFQSNPKDRSATADIHELSPGIYVIEVRTDQEERFTKKFVKK